MKRKWLAIGIILLFVGTCIIPLTISKQTYGKTVITVDDEPGDADYISIKDAVNNSKPGDVIEVYSGTYVEDDILIDTPDFILKGMPYELGGGNDTGKPLIVRKGYKQIIQVVTDNITISGFTMEDNNSQTPGRYQGHFIDVHSANRCLISNNTIQDGTNYSVGIDCSNTSSVQIIDNIVCNMDESGIIVSKSNNVSVFGNTINNSIHGIFIDSSEAINITKNKINRCDNGISLDKSHNITLYLNNLESNYFGLRLMVSTKIIIKHNNFINNSRDVGWLAVKVPIIQRWSSVLNSWIGNYWDGCKIGPKIIPGIIFIFILYIPAPGFEFMMPIGIPLLLFQLDRHPAQEPYDIPGMR